MAADGRQSRILFVKNLNYNIHGADLYELFGRYGAIRQIRLGDTQQTRGTAYVVYEEVGDARNALTHLNGFHLQERYIVGTWSDVRILTKCSTTFHRASRARARWSSVRLSWHVPRASTAFTDTLCACECDARVWYGACMRA